MMDPKNASGAADAMTPLGPNEYECAPSFAGHDPLTCPEATKREVDRILGLGLLELVAELSKYAAHWISEREPDLDDAEVQAAYQARCARSVSIDERTGELVHAALAGWQALLDRVEMDVDARARDQEKISVMLAQLLEVTRG